MPPAAKIGPALLPGADPEMSYRLFEVQRALGQLPAWQREIILHVGLGRQKQDDTAATLGFPIGTARSRLARTRERLRDLTDK